MGRGRPVLVVRAEKTGYEGVSGSLWFTSFFMVYFFMGYSLLYGFPSPHLFFLPPSAITGRLKTGRCWGRECKIQRGSAPS